MDSARTQRIEDLFHRAADLPHGERAAFLAQQCGDDTALLAAVETLLLHDAPEKTDSPFRSPLAAQRLQPSDTAPPLQIGNYRIISKVGQGGMGVVYEAEQLRPVRRTVALKVIKLGMDTRDLIARFEAERQALAVMDHPGIARVYDAGATEAGRPYFVMEFVRGSAFTRYCDDKTLSTRQRLELFVKVCDAVQHAHTKGIIHRDLKPGNILVTEIDGAPSPKVIDFGIVKATAPLLTEHTMPTESGQMLGTPEYMSPEQARIGNGADVDTRSDVYSLGAVLYELLSGSQPFAATSMRAGGYHEIVRIIRDTDPPRPSTRLTRTAEGERIAALRQETAASLSSCLRRELEWIPLKAMRKERDARYRSAAELADDVRAYLAGRPLIAAPEARGYRVRKFLYRHQRVVAAVAAMLLLLITGIITTSIQAIRATRAERIAKQESAEAEQRFNDVRALARGMLFDVQEQVVKLPGSQDATRKIVDLSKEYLEKLQAEKSGDAVLIADVASAYGRLGDIQGGANFVSANKLAASRASWEKSLELANRALKLAPRNVEPLRAAANAELALADAERAAGSLDASAKHLDHSLALYTTAAEVLPDSVKRKHDVILVQMRIASLRSQQNKIPESIELMTRAVDQARALHEKEPDNRDVQLLLASGLFDLSLYRARAGDAAGAEQAQSESLTRYESLVAADPNNARYERLLAANYLSVARRAKDRNDAAAQERYLARAMQHARKLAANDSTSAPFQFLFAEVLFNDSDFRFARKEYAQATQSLNEAIGIYEKLLAANANDRRARTMLGVCYGQLAEQLEAQEKYDAALVAVTKAAETFAAGGEADSNSLNAQAGRAYYDLVTGRIQSKAGHLDDAVPTLRRALASFERVVAASPQDNDNRHNVLAARQTLAETLIALSDLSQTRPDGRGRAQLRAEALALLQQARDGYALLLNTPNPSPADTDAVKELNQKIEQLKNPPTTQPG